MMLLAFLFPGKRTMIDGRNEQRYPPATTISQPSAILYSDKEAQRAVTMKPEKIVRANQSGGTSSRSSNTRCPAGCHRTHLTCPYLPNAAALPRSAFRENKFPRLVFTGSPDASTA